MTDLFIDYDGVLRDQFGFACKIAGPCKAYGDQKLVNLYNRAQENENLRRKLFLNTPCYPNVLDRIQELANSRKFTSINILTYQENVFINFTVEHMRRHGFINTSTPLFISKESDRPRFNFRVIEKFQCSSGIDSIIFINSSEAKVKFMDTVSDSYLLIDDRLETIKKIEAPNKGVWVRGLWQEDEATWKSDVSGKKKNIMMCDNFFSTPSITLTKFVDQVI